MIRLLTDVLLLGISAFLFSLSFPGFLSTWGLSPVAFIAFLPLPFVLRRNGYGGTALLGILYGYGSYALFNYWLAKFHPLAHVIVPVIYGGYFLLLFPLLKAADDLFPEHGYLIQLALWIAYEHVRTLGFIGYSYGTIGYSQYLFLELSGVASITGVLGVSALVAFPSFFLGHLFIDLIAAAPEERFRAFLRWFRAHRIPAVAFVVLLLTAVVFGVSVRTDYSEEPMWRVALIQQNVDPWRGGTRAFRVSLDKHLALSRAAELERPDIVIWSETAFVPSISWHTRFRTDQDRYLLVRELTDFLDTREIPYVIGNGDGRLATPGLPPQLPDGTWNRKDYNAVLLYEDGAIRETYRKLRLVPFTESFPFKEQLPLVYRWLEAADTHFWEPGDTYTVFESGGVSFSTPICYEDTFGYISRHFVREGAQVIVNITNDSWSASVAAEMQHMAMSVFRAIENRRTVVRSTNGGITCTIEPSGRITSMLEPFVEGYLVHDVPVYDDTTTVYTRFGDWFGVSSLVLSMLALLIGLLRRVCSRRGDNRDVH